MDSIVSHEKVKTQAAEYKKMVDRAISEDGDSSKNFENLGGLDISVYLPVFFNLVKNIKIKIF